MRKVIVELNLPDDQAIPDSSDIVRLTDPNWMSEWWHIDDVIEQAEPENQLTEDEAKEVLMLMDKRHDCHYGHTWDSMDSAIDDVVSRRK
jgi:hypothetical protein